MRDVSYCFDDAVSTYAISDAPIEKFSHHLPIAGGRLIVNYTSRTDVCTTSKGQREIVVIGICIDSHGELSREEIPAYLVNTENSDIVSVYRATRRFAGRYLIFYRDGNAQYLFGDACCLLQINYARQGDRFCAAATDKLVGDYFSLSVSKSALDVQYSGALFLALPYNMTMYEEVKCLLANHYLELSSLSIKRVPLEVRPSATGEQQNQAIKRTTFLVENILRAYCAKGTIACPLTGGIDSRVVFSFLKRQLHPLFCYTFRHANFTDQHGDLVVPQMLARDYALNYHVYEDVSAPQDYLDAVWENTGNWHSPYTVSLAYTLNTYLPGYIIPSSDILDQVGKSTFGKDLPECFATASFFTCKVHKCSDRSTKEMREFVKDASLNSGVCSKYDLFAIEIDGSRWVAQTSMLYSLCGITILNPFNCGELINCWLSLSRKQRTDSFIHQALLKTLDPSLLKYPINPGKKYAFLKSSPFAVLLGTYVMYYGKKLGFLN